MSIVKLISVRTEGFKNPYQSSWSVSPKTKLPNDSRKHKTVNKKYSKPCIPKITQVTYSLFSKLKKTDKTNLTSIFHLVRRNSNSTLCYYENKNSHKSSFSLYITHALDSASYPVEKLFGRVRKFSKGGGGAETRRAGIVRVRIHGLLTIDYLWLGSTSPLSPKHSPYAGVPGSRSILSVSPVYLWPSAIKIYENSRSFVK